MQPLFSVIIPLYNKENYIQNTIDSVLNQSLKDYEIIVIDDKSTDASLNLVTKHYNSKIRILTNAVNKGLSETRNIGIANAKGAIIALLDADDVWRPSYLESIKKLHDTFPEAQLYGTDYKEMYSKTNILVPQKNIPKTYKGTAFIVEDFFTYNLHQPIICPSSLAFKKSILGQDKAFDPSITYAEDIDFFIRYCSKFKMAYHYESLILKILNVKDQITSNPISNKQLPNLDAYENWCQDNNSLKAFIDLHRYIFSYQYKVERNIPQKEKTLQHINYANLTYKQRFILKSPRWMVLLMNRIKLILLKNNLRVSSF